MSLLSRLRRIALDRQGLLRQDGFGRGKGATLRAIEQLGYVQIDTISVVERAHHHVLKSRVSNYQPVFLERLMRERRIFEYWFHAAAWLPMRDYRFALPRMAQMNGDRSWFPEADSGLMKEIVHRVESEGPLRARDFEDTRQGKTGWWDWKPAKQALEQLFMQGELMVSRRDGFQKVYDLPERVIPDDVDTRHPDNADYAAYLIDTTLRAHGFATMPSMTYLRKGQRLRDSVRDQLESRLETGTLVTCDLKSHGRIFIAPDLLEARAPRCSARLCILSPFDNAVIQRARARDLFDFNYQIECYVPEAKRQFGYFCLPLLYRDRFVGRIDCKAHRDRRCLELKSLHLEHKVDTEFAEALRLALIEFATFNNCENIDLSCDQANRLLSALPESGYRPEYA